jgi:hypothetical protein
MVFILSPYFFVEKGVPVLWPPWRQLRVLRRSSRKGIALAEDITEEAIQCKIYRNSKVKTKKVSKFKTYREVWS